MSDDALQKALAAVNDATKDSQQLEIMRAAVIAQAVIQGLQAQQPSQTQSAAPSQPFDAKKWLVIGGVVVSVGLVGALFAVAIAIGATCATACLLILRSMWCDFQKGN